MTHAEKARDLFLKGYNCSQAVFIAYCDLTGLDERNAALIASSFGGGMGRMREVCGAVSGMLMTAGVLYGYDDPNASGEKAAHYARVQELAGRFKERNSSIICRDILGRIAEDKSFIPQERNEKYYSTRPCAKMVYDAAEILEQYISGKKET